MVILPTGQARNSRLLVIRPGTTDIAIHTPAKLNLFFEVLGKRPDGYHEIETLMCPIGLYDSLCFHGSEGDDIALECSWGMASQGCSGFETVPLDGKNLVWRAIDLVRRRAGIQHGARVQLIKRIPTAAGLGGGSSDAAAALVAANFAWKLQLPQAELLAMAAELGSDVPFFLGRGPAICRGRGERIEAADGLGSLNFVVVRPPEGLATAAVYGVCRPPQSPQPLEPLIAALRAGDACQTGRRLFNRLQEAADQLSPAIERLARVMAAEDCLGHGMSGSGTAYFGLFRTAREARRVARRLRARDVGFVAAVQSCV